MNNRGAYQVGLLSLGLSLALRLGPTLGSFAASPGFWRTLDEVLLYSQTGLLPAPCQPEAYVYAPESHSPGNALVPLPVFSVRRQPEEEPEAPLVFSPQDGAAVKLDNDAGLSVDPERLILEAPALPDLPGPKVLLYSTHATESYQKNGENYIETAAYRSLDSGFNMLSLGRALEEALEARGIGVLRDESLHDYPSYNSAYIHSRKAMEEALTQNPSIVLALDLHRDAAAGTHQPRLLADTPTGPTAKLMLVVGTNAAGRTHPNWQQNLSLALRLQTLLERESPGITRPLNLRAQRFNQDLCPGALLLEIGGAGNTRQEALATVPILAEAIEDLLNASK